MFSARFSQWMCATVLLAGSANVLAVPDAQFVPAFEVFLRATQGDNAAIGKAVDAFAALTRAEPTNPVLLGYSGASIALQAKTTLLPWKKMAYAEDGLAQLDKALAMLKPAHNAAGQNQVPAVLDVKLVAANTYLALPRMMNRHDQGRRLLGEVANSPLLAGSPAAFREAVQKALDKTAPKAVAAGAK